MSKRKLPVVAFENEEAEHLKAIRATKDNIDQINGLRKMRTTYTIAAIMSAIGITAMSIISIMFAQWLGPVVFLFVAGFVAAVSLSIGYNKAIASWRHNGIDGITLQTRDLDDREAKLGRFYRDTEIDHG